VFEIQSASLKISCSGSFEYHMNNAVNKGTLKQWNDGKGYGFIGSQEGRKDILVP
jgi:hypothetical protein